MEIIEVLTCEDSEESLRFLVDNTANYVLAYYDGFNPFLVDGLHNPCFKISDCFQILSYGWMIPMGFEIFPRNTSVVVPKFNIQYYTSSDSTPKNLPGQGDYLIHESMFNCEIAHGAFYDLTGIVDIVNDTYFILRMKLTLEDPVIAVSMIGVPDSLNGYEFCIKPYLKIKHNFKLTDFPA